MRAEANTSYDAAIADRLRSGVPSAGAHGGDGGDIYGTSTYLMRTLFMVHMYLLEFAEHTL